MISFIFSNINNFNNKTFQKRKIGISPVVVVVTMVVVVGAAVVVVVGAGEVVVISAGFRK